MKNLDKKQAVLCHRKPLGRQRTRQRYLPQCIIGFLLLLISIAIQAQIPQELIDKARAAGMTEEQIQREIAKHRTEQTGINQIIKPATENTVSDRSHPTQQALLPLTEQRDEHKPKQPLENIVFGREIFSDNLTHSFLSDWGKFAALKSILSAKPSHPGPIHSHLSPRFSTPFMQQEE